MAYPVGNGDGPIIESLEEILADCFFQIVEVSWIKDATVRRQAREMLASSGVEVRYGAYPHILTQSLNLNSLNEGCRKTAVKAMEVAIDEALELGATKIGLMSGPYEGESNRAANMDALEHSLNDICSYADRFGVTILLEPFDRDVDKKSLIGPVECTKEIAERVTRIHSNFGVIVDLSHIPLLHESPDFALRPIATYIRHVHIGNCCLGPVDDPAYGDKHPRFGYSNGVNDVPEIVVFLKELLHIGYLHADGETARGISFEIKPLGNERPSVMIAGAKRRLFESWRQLTIELNLAGR